MATMKGLVGICTDKRKGATSVTSPLFLSCLDASRWVLPHLRSSVAQAKGPCEWDGVCPYSRGTWRFWMLSLTLYSGLSKDANLCQASCNPAFFPSFKVAAPFSST